jgi:hypothetical protein
MLKRRAGLSARTLTLTACSTFPLLFALLIAAPTAAQPSASPAVTAIRAGRLLDPEAGRILTNQIIVVEGTRIRAERPDSRRRAGDRSVADDRAARPRRGA